MSATYLPDLYSHNVRLSRGYPFSESKKNDACSILQRTMNQRDIFEYRNEEVKGHVFSTDNGGPVTGLSMKTFLQNSTVFSKCKSDDEPTFFLLGFLHD